LKKKNSNIVMASDANRNIPEEIVGNVYEGEDLLLILGKNFIAFGGVGCVKRGNIEVLSLDPVRIRCEFDESYIFSLMSQPKLIGCTKTILLEKK